jgi:SPP1 gp7 family putative phage head morphogenesis protein
MRSKDWNLSRRVELKYRQSLIKIQKMIQKGIRKFKNPSDIIRYLHQLSQSEELKTVAIQTANRFVTMSNVVNAKTWREAARESSQSATIFREITNIVNSPQVGQVIQRQIVENASLIRTLPLVVAQDVTKFVSSKAYEGLRASTIANELHSKIEGYSNARANLIARTETSKAMTALTESRSKSIGINWYIWRTANDGERVRKSHANMKDVIVKYDDPPSPEELIEAKSEGHYNAGNIYNCRCFPRPLISPKNITWPARVYYNGVIQKMSQQQFEKIM